MMAVIAAGFLWSPSTSEASRKATTATQRTKGSFRLSGVRGRAIAAGLNIPRWAIQAPVQRNRATRMRILHKAAAKRQPSSRGDEFRKVFLGPRELRLADIADVMYDAGLETFYVFMKNSGETATGRYLEVQADTGARIDMSAEIFSDEPGPPMDPMMVRDEQIKSMLFGDEAFRRSTVKTLFFYSAGESIRINVQEIVSVSRSKLKGQIVITTQNDAHQIRLDDSILIPNEKNNVVDSYRKARSMLSIDFGVSRFSMSP